MFDSIWQGGVVAVSIDDHESMSRADRERFLQLVDQADQLSRLHAIATPPPLCPDSACWAAQTMYFLCRVLLNRIETEVNLPAALVESEPDGRIASQHGSVDLVFRVLPDLERRCAGANALDPLRQTIRQLASRWPLSGVGIDCEFDVGAKQVVLADDSMRAELVDRISSRDPTQTLKWPELENERAAVASVRSRDAWNETNLP